MKHALILALLALSACSPKVVTKERPVIVKTPVAAPCSFPRPDKPLPLPGHWAQMDLRQKAAALGKYAIEWTNYAEALNAATAACPEIR